MGKNKIIILLRPVILSCLILISCSKSGGGSSESAVPTASTNIFSFTPSATPSDNSVYLEKNSIDNDQITLDVKIKGGNNIYGAAIEITYDGSKISFISSSKGDFLSHDGEKIDFLNKLYKNKEGILLIGINRRSNASGMNGDGILCTVVFKAITSQTNTPVGFNSTNSVLESQTGNIPGTTWLGGDLSY